MRYVRTNRDRMVHKATCPYRGPFAVEWQWANDKTPEQIIAESARSGIRHQWCRRCFKDHFPDLNNRLAV